MAARDPGDGSWLYRSCLDDGRTVELSSATEISMGITVKMSPPPVTGTLLKVPENEFTQAKKVTLRGLLSHSAGVNVASFIGYLTHEQVPTLAQILDGVKPANTPPIRVEQVPGNGF